MRISELQKAFGLATKCAEQPNIPLRQRNHFRAIAHLIWKSFQPAADAERAGGLTYQQAREFDLRSLIQARQREGGE